MEFILFIAILPAVVTYTFVYIHDVHDVEPIKHLIISFILGILSVIPVVIIELLLNFNVELMYQVFFDVSSPTTITLFIEALVVIALVEELSRYLILTQYCYTLPEFSEPFDGIMYGVSVALGFAVIENILYSIEYGQATAIARAFTAIPGHTMFGMIQGYWIGRAYADTSSTNKRTIMIRGFLIATVLHGLYDFFLELPYGLLMSVGMLPLIALYCYRAWQEHYQIKFAPPIIATVKQEQPALLAQESQCTKSLARLMLHIHTIVFLGLGVYGVVHRLNGGQEVAHLHQYDTLLYCVLISMVLIVELVACGLRVGSSTAWYACLAIFLLTLFSPLFPISIIGLFGLFHPQIYEQGS